MNLLKKILKGLLITLLVLLVIACTLPYLLPVNQQVLAAGELPFANSHFMRLNNVDIHYRIYEPAKDSVKGNVLLIHGFCGSTFSWRNNADTMAAAGYRVVSVDLPGFGFSDHSQGINHAAGFNGGLLWKLLDSVAPANWVIVGHSMGAGTAMAMQAIRPTKTAGLILVDGAFASNRDSGNRSLIGWFITSGVVKRWAEVLGKAFFFNTAKITQLLQSAYSAKPDSIAVQGYLQPLMLKNTASCIMNLAGSKETVNVDPGTINVPVLSIWGKDDSWVPYSRAHIYLEPIKDIQTVIIDNAGHCPMETEPDAFNGAVAGFLATLRVKQLN